LEEIAATVAVAASTTRVKRQRRSRLVSELAIPAITLWVFPTVHSEYYFTDVLWPAFRKIDFLRAIRAYQERTRRFGR
jgi:short-chain Z-isoprenyl diphosphate synthase